MLPNDGKTLYKDIDSHNQSMTMVLDKQNGTLTKAHLEAVLHPNKHPFALFSNDRVRHHGHFDSLPQEVHETQMQRLWSFASDKGFSAVWFSHGKNVSILRKQNFALSDEFVHTVILLEANTSLSLVTEHSDQRPRGIKERPCGRWIATKYDAATTYPGPKDSIWEMISFSTEITSGSNTKLQQEFQRSAASNRAQVVSLTLTSRKTAGAKTRFELMLHGTGQKMNDQDLRDILVSQMIVHSVEISTGGSELILYARNDEDRIQEDRPTKQLYTCIPAGARLLLTIASGWRRQHVLQFSKAVDDKENNQEGSSVPTLDSNADDTIRVLLPEHTKLGSLWKTFNVNGKDRLEVVVDSSSIAASAIPMEPLQNHQKPVYAVCGTVLELRNGLKVSNLTVLPREGHFLILALLSFGLISLEDLDVSNDARRDLPEPYTILSAIAFNESCKSLGETLTCFPDKAADLLRLFNADDENHAVTPDLMKDLKSNPITASNLLMHQKAYKSAKRSEELARISTIGMKQRPASDAVDDNCPSIGATLEPFHRASLGKLFATDSDEPLEVDKLYASNLMSFIILSHRGKCVCVDDWEIRTVQLGCSSSSSHMVWFAHWADSDISSYLPSLGGCAWNVTALTNQRPIAIQEALQCLPPKLRPLYFHKMQSIKTKAENGGGGEQQQLQQRLVFDSVEVAIQMEAAFWLERQFHTPQHHWYQRGSEVHLMIEALKRLQLGPVGHN
jgi:hypothetical protein